MYTLIQREAAVKLLIKYEFAYMKTKRELGYPSSRTTLRKWYHEFLAEGEVKVSYKRKSRYSDDQINAAIECYKNNGRSISATIRRLGYPSRAVLSRWLTDSNVNVKISKAGGVVIKYNQKEKKEAVLDFITRTESAERIADNHNISRTSLYKWGEELLSKEAYQMKNNKKSSNKHNDNTSLMSLESEREKLIRENDRLRKENERLVFENDILEVAEKLIKKEMGVSLNGITNAEKAILINALKHKYRLSMLLNRLKMPKSSYYYHNSMYSNEDKYQVIRKDIVKIFESSYRSYGYRRIHRELKKTGTIISEKIVRRLMKEENIKVIRSSKSKYTSYLGEISPAVPNIIDRNFKAEKPNQKWLTDITQFAIPAGKIYLSPIIDCFDGLPVSWTIGTSPNANLVNTMLVEGVKTLKNEERPVVHSDRGAHYRWPQWIELMNEFSLTRSMSKKGCSPDNSACEGFFGTIKEEMFNNRDWRGWSLEDFINYLHTYLEWFSSKRIKLSLNGMSPIEYRHSLGL